VEHEDTGPPFEVTKLGHVVMRAADLGRSVDFYTRVLGFRLSDVYPQDMMPGGHGVFAL